ncbi:hypothetical protein J2736_000248 [Paenibacillus qinlingensis]|uniref:Uncharacterized protein n=1 Tax=Paenibacillus qinlingensis TaxID=1837343 RepID=A0ABU1NNL8_9BACL|nr:hypothetical protein [Paenibacillus qinlingensis]
MVVGRTAYALITTRTTPDHPLQNAVTAPW